ncbi:MAG: hypothetical protein KDB23_01165 [Planctomycetales bacterium]|nr:hypothetical protein [Planctomycetales bacterium]
MQRKRNRFPLCSRAGQKLLCVSLLLTPWTQQSNAAGVEGVPPIALDMPALSRQAVEVARRPLPAKLVEQAATAPATAAPFSLRLTSPSSLQADHQATVRMRQNTLEMVFGDRPDIVDGFQPELTLQTANFAQGQVSEVATETETPLPPGGALSTADEPLLPSDTSGATNDDTVDESSANISASDEPIVDSPITQASPTESADDTQAAAESDSDGIDAERSVETPPTSPQNSAATTGQEKVAGRDAPALQPSDADVDRDVDPNPATEEVPAAQAETDPPVVVEPEKPLPPPPGYVLSLRRPIEQALQTHVQARLNTADDSCWSIMHSFLAWGPATEINVGGPRGQRSNAIRWLAQNQACGGRRLFFLDQDHLRGREGPGYQGHPAQFLAMLAQCNIDPNLPMSVGGRNFTVKDLIREEQMTCSADAELTFKLIGLSHYLGTDASWVSHQGVPWTMERVLQLEMSQPVNGAACGGTHRLMSISFAVQARKRTGQPLTGTWARAEKYIRDYHRYTYSLQNSDGSFSSDWFKRRTDRGDLDRRVQTTGHILEWLVYSLPNEALYDAQVVRAVNFLANSLVQHRYHDFEVGPKYHAIRALRLYHQRVFQASQTTSGPLARRVEGQAGGR